MVSPCEPEATTSFKVLIASEVSARQKNTQVPKVSYAANYGVLTRGMTPKNHSRHESNLELSLSISADYHLVRNKDEI